MSKKNTPVYTSRWGQSLGSQAMDVVWVDFTVIRSPPASDRSEGDSDETCYGWMAFVRARGRFCDDGGGADGEGFGGGACGDVVEARRISWWRRYGADAGRQ